MTSKEGLNAKWFEEPAKANSRDDLKLTVCKL